MSNLTDNYLATRNIALRCEESLAAMEADDYLRPNVEALLLLAREEMELLAKSLPF